MKVLVQKLNEPNINNHIYTTECIKDAIINSPCVNEAINSKSCFVFKKCKWGGLELSRVLASDVVGVINRFFIENKDGTEYLCADIDFKDKSYDEVYLAGFGDVTVNDDEKCIVSNYTYDYCFVEDGDINEK